MSVQKRKSYSPLRMSRTLWTQIRGKRSRWIGVGIFQLIAVFFYLYRTGDTYVNGYGLVSCKADFFVWEDMLMAKFSFVIPIALFVFGENEKEMGSEQFLVRQVSRGAIWQETVFRIGMISALFTVFHTVCVFLYAQCSNADAMNWTDKRSLFWFMTEGKLCRQGTISYWQVILWFFIFSFLSYFFTGMVVSFCRIVFQNTIPAWMFCLGMLLAEQAASQPVFFYGRVSLLYQNWLRPRFIEITLFGIIIILGIYAAGRYALRRKNYYGKT